MEFQLIRQYFKPHYTIGSLYYDHHRLCNTLEPHCSHLTSHSTMNCINFKKLFGPIAIPTGRYPVVIARSRSTGVWLPTLVGVKGFSDIHIHRGNKPCETNGSILPGYNRHRGCVLQSTACMNTIMLLMQSALDKGKPIYISVKE